MAALSEFLNLEGNIDARIEKAREFAAKIMSTQINLDMSSLELILRVQIALYYKIPIFSDYFDKLTLDQLVFELECIKLSIKSGTEQTSDLLSENKEEASKMFDDWSKEDEGQWVDEPIQNPMSDEEFQKEAARFMQTGEFKEDKKD